MSKTGDTLVIELPVRGQWKLIKSPGHAPFAFDLVAVDEESHKMMKHSRLQHLLGRARAGDSYSWGKPIYAPIDGKVVCAHDGSLDRLELSLLRDIWTMLFSQPPLQSDDLTPFAGNHVIIAGADTYVFLAHMQNGSLPVKEGDVVVAGQLIGRVGNSGFTLEPHLHLQLFDQLDDLLAASAPPFLVAEYERWTGDRWEHVEYAALEKGELIRAL